MRSVWSTLVAVTLVVAGARVATAQPRHADHSELHVAKCLHVAPATRRAPRTARVLDLLVAVARVELPAASRRVLPSEPGVETSQPLARRRFVRSARGPPLT
ncbi:MAG: hypothetical protein ABJE66_00940 [Deltaproteobacteria bacterium]